MANKRMIYSDLFEDDFLSSLDLFGRFLWVGLIGAVMDDQGRAIDNAAIIRARVFPYDQVSDAQVEAVIATLAHAGKLLRYMVNGKKLLQIVNWWKFQQPSWAAESKFPAPDGWTDRVKVHVKGNKVLTINWDQEGGFAKLHSPAPAIQSVDVHSGLHSQLPSRLDSHIEEYEVKSESESEGEGEVEVEGAGAQKPATAAATLTRPVIYAVYEREIGPLTPMIADQLDGFEKDYPPEWFEMAVREAITHNKRNLAYVGAILKRWKVDGPAGMRAAVPKGREDVRAPGIGSSLKERNDAVIEEVLRGMGL